MADEASALDKGAWKIGWASARSHYRWRAGLSALVIDAAFAITGIVASPACLTWQLVYGLGATVGGPLIVLLTLLLNGTIHAPGAQRRAASQTIAKLGQDKQATIHRLTELEQRADINRLREELVLARHQAERIWVTDLRCLPQVIANAERVGQRSNAQWPVAAHLRNWIDNMRKAAKRRGCYELAEQLAAVTYEPRPESLQAAYDEVCALIRDFMERT